MNHPFSFGQSFLSHSPDDAIQSFQVHLAGRFGGVTSCIPALGTHYVCTVCTEYSVVHLGLLVVLSESISMIRLVLVTFKCSVEG